MTISMFVWLLRTELGLGLSKVYTRKWVKEEILIKKGSGYKVTNKISQ
jgi:hypothetical protein